MHYKLALLGAVAVVAVGAALWRSRVLRVSTRLEASPARQAADLRRAVSALYDKQPFEPRTSITSVAAIDQVFAIALDEDLRALSLPRTGAHAADKIADLRAQLATIVFSRFFQSDFDTYHQSMAAMGFRLSDIEWLRENWGADDYYEQVVGSPCPPDISNEDLVRSIWDATKTIDLESSQIAAIGSGRGAIDVVFQRTCPNSLSRWPLLTGELGDVGWSGGRFGAFSFFYEPVGRQWQDLLRSQVCFETATVGLVVRLENGEAYPYQFYFWYDEELSRWRLGQVAMGNITSAVGHIFF
ncbi:MAG: hypothetical protein DYG94_14820 [Leptolyngbya sp. PLA3]|nr:MAG: hypothetical protein EDM82_15200 [Cyanobacteria bacterium CYA]MCE7970002.1 hypothetical protein [Leptolyngbya sp. PL-A3]